MSMTESEPKKIKVLVAGGDRGAGKALKAQMELLEELEEYRAIGTVSEFRELKEKATAIKSDGFSDHLLNMGYTKGMKDGYAKAIDEFAERIKARAHSTERNDWSADYMISIWESVIDEIAMELKGE